MDSRGSNNSVKGFPRIHPKVTINGMTKSAICWRHSIKDQSQSHAKRNRLTIELPTATPKESVSLSLTDTVTAVTCSEQQPC